MKILVIYNNLGRHSVHDEMLSNEFPDALIEIVENIKREDLEKSDVDFIIIHRNNPENDIVERNCKIGRIRIFFSGGLPKYQQFDNDHYVPIKQLRDKTKAIINEQTDKVEKVN